MSGFGDALRHARGNKGVTLSEAEVAIRIPRKYLRALEDEDFAALPDGVYARGIVRNYAQYLHLDPDDAILWFEEIRGGASGGFKVVPAVRPMEVPSHWAPNFALIAFVVVISAVIFAWLYSAFFAIPETPLPTPTPSQPTPTPIDVSAAILALTPTTTRPPSPTVAVAPPSARPAPPASTAPPTVEQAAPTAAQVPVTPEASVAATVAPAAAAVIHVVSVQALGTARVTVTVDGVVAFDGELAADETADFEGQSITIESGRATSIYLFVDGAEYGYMSESSPQAVVSIP
jgi:cytoskeletal protein RodZ